MYEASAIFFVIVLSLTNYYFSTSNQGPYLTQQIILTNHINTPQYELYATCIDKQSTSSNPFIDLKLTFNQPPTFLILFQSHPILQCIQITHSLDINNINQKDPSIRFDQILMLKGLIGETQIINLPAKNQLKIDNEKQFLYILTKKEKNQLQVTQQKNQKSTQPVTMSMEKTNQEYLGKFLSSVFWFSWFNLIGISLISYYRKNLFNSKIHLSISLTILIYLISISFIALPSFERLQKQLKLVMLCFILLICIKIQISMQQTLYLLFITTVNQLLLEYIQDIKIVSLFYLLNLMSTFVITLGYNKDVMKFSIFSFVIQTGVINPFFETVDPLPLSFILVNLIFGPTIYQLLELKRDLTISQKRTRQKLRSYEISQTDQLFRY